MKLTEEIDASHVTGCAKLIEIAHHIKPSIIDDSCLRQ